MLGAPWARITVSTLPGTLPKYQWIGRHFRQCDARPHDMARKWPRSGRFRGVRGSRADTTRGANTHGGIGGEEPVRSAGRTPGGTMRLRLGFIGATVLALGLTVGTSATGGAAGLCADHVRS